VKAPTPTDVQPGPAKATRQLKLEKMTHK